MSDDAPKIDPGDITTTVAIEPNHDGLATTAKPSPVVATVDAAADALAIVAISNMLGFPLPPTITKSVLVALGGLVTTAIALPATWLQTKIDEMRATSAAKNQTMLGTVPNAVKRIGDDDELGKRAALFLGGKMLREQTNREAITAEALEDVRNDPPREDASRPIDEDWVDVLFSSRVREEQRRDAHLLRPHPLGRDPQTWLVFSRHD